MRVIERSLSNNGRTYWLCFGPLINLIRDKSTDKMDDIDVGVFYEDYKELDLANSFNKWGYTLRKKILDDQSKYPLYYSFKHPDFPPVDVFLWYEHNGIYYHTYDYHQEKRTIPSEYVFKGVPVELFPKRGIHPAHDVNITRTFFGKKREPMFNFEINIPSKYGELMDFWYPNWLIEKEMQSMSPYVVKMKSTKMWHDPKYVNDQIAKSKKDYEAYRERFK